MKSNDAEILLPFDFKMTDEVEQPPWKSRKGITFQVNETYHDRYMAAQAKTNGRLGKELKRLIERAIDQVEPDKAG